MQPIVHRSYDGGVVALPREGTRLDPASMPELILLDLNLPRVDGAQVLSHIRQTQAYKATPVIILTSSDSPRDRETALRLGASLYFRKPTDLTSFMMLGAVIRDAARRARSD